MSECGKARFDLNPLVVFDVLLIESSVTRAAERLGRTQSTFRHSLSRLRQQFGNPLLTKGGMRMQPTAFALDLIEQVRPMLSGIQRVLSPAHIFARATVAAGILN
jgi:DNA-binding transcriptional LysR family regulator